MRQFIFGVTGTSLVATALALSGAGLASAAPSVVGMTYEKAQATVQSSGLSTEIATSTGTELQQSDCIVVSQTVRPEKISGRVYTASAVLLSLNCNAVVASPGHPGNSAASPEARAAKKVEEANAWKATPDGLAWCEQAARLHPDWLPLEGCPT